MPEKKSKNVFKKFSLFSPILLVILSCLTAAAILSGGFYLFVLRRFNEQFSHLFLLYILSLTGVVSLVSALLSRIISSIWTKSEKEINRVLREIANGNFDVQINMSANEHVNKIIEDVQKVLQELKSVKILRNDFISNFSHEFKTPLVNINGFAELLLADDLTEKERKEYAQIIYDESNRLAALSKNTLLMNKLSSQAIIQNKAEYSLDEQLRQCVAQFMREINAKNLQVECDAAPTIFCGDEGLMQRVWINLLSNAIKFSEENGKLTVSLRANGKHAVVKVTDEGCGMSEETIKHVFDEFYQGDTSHKTEGNGLGLSIVYRIIQLCDGTISVDSALGKGSTFTVTLPL